MRLTLKDKDFLERLRILMDSKDLAIELKYGGFKRFVLRQNYGDKIENAFKMTRQGVRWRFQRLFNEIYVNAYLAIFWIESNFGTELRQKALEIAIERVEFRKKALKIGLVKATRKCKGIYPPKNFTKNASNSFIRSLIRWDLLL
jgi:hypothetical protein